MQVHYGVVCKVLFVVVNYLFCAFECYVSTLLKVIFVLFCLLQIIIIILPLRQEIFLNCERVGYHCDRIFIFYIPVVYPTYDGIKCYVRVFV